MTRLSDAEIEDILERRERYRNWRDEVPPRRHMSSYHDLRTIDMMRPGQSGWTTPWAMGYDLNGRPYLNTRYSIRDASFGTATLHVTRTHTSYRVSTASCATWHWKNENMDHQFYNAAVEQVNNRVYRIHPAAPQQVIMVITTPSPRRVRQPVLETVAFVVVVICALVMGWIVADLIKWLVKVLVAPEIEF